MRNSAPTNTSIPKEKTSTTKPSSLSAREEAAGTIRWLRPEYQVPLFKKTGDKQQVLKITESEEEVGEPETKSKERKKKGTALPWPASLSDRMKAVLGEVEKRGHAPFSAEEIARSFKRAQTPQVVEILETLCAVGKARKAKETGRYLA